MADLKDLGKDIWSNKPLLYALLVVAAIGAYVLYKRAQSQNAVDTGVATNAAPGASGTYVNEDFSYYAPSTTTFAPLPTPPVATQPSSQPTVAGQPTTGLLGQKVKISKKNGVYVYKLPGGTSGFLSQVLPHGATDIAPGAQGRWWYHLNGLKYLITSGTGPAVTNNATAKGG